MPTLLDLPDELLLLVGDQFDGRTHNNDLSSLSLANQRLRHIAQEKLLCDPCFNLTNIHAYLWELCKNPGLLPRIRQLEIRSSRDGRADDDYYASRGALPRILRPHYQRNDPQNYDAIECPPALPQWPGFLDSCSQVIISTCGAPYSDIHPWLQDLRTDIMPALFGILLAILPNLKEMYFANGWLMDFTIFSSLRTLRHRPLLPRGWAHNYLEHAINKIADKIEVLEFPTDVDGVHWILSQTPFDFRKFKNLRRLSIPMQLLTEFRRHETPPNPSSFIPETVELLRISEASYPAINFVNEVCLAKKHGRFPYLQRVELYYYSTIKQIKSLARRFRCPHPIHDVRRMFLDAELGLYMYFPSVIIRTAEVGETPWKLREEGLLKQLEDDVYEKYVMYGMVRAPAFELGVDATGDLEMTDY
ncbi:hypothetical protein BDV96DRAFT_647481 [Lophiotrema nucula]|uniref:F-box domain-containing protein n=1 Tax=Lophiotrema nucula TaxID=690887 RepID=A0A6A5Z3K8_9PLEO|nr:hypothetical protein BDV96DRAFT_647481 [Lophiotrema nucula]